MSDLPEWIIFDGDNTLWAVEPIYNEARSEFCNTLEKNELLRAMHENITASDIEVVQRNKDMDLFSYMGYSSDRFARSFEETIRHFLPHVENEDVKQLLKHSRGIAHNVFQQRAIPFHGVGDLLTTLKSKNIKLGLLTIGERWVQKKRCDEFPYIKLFDLVQIESDPKAEIILEITSRYKLSAQTSWLVGDSLESDVLPAVRIGMNAIWLAHPNWDKEQIIGSHIVNKDKESLREELLRFNLDPDKAVLAESLENLYQIFGLSLSVPQPHPPLLAYAIFEGGGAKGLAHIGAYHACVSRNIEFLGVAGTSAGSIVAGLIAVGCKPDKIFSPTGGGLLDVDYDSIIGQEDWKSGKNLIGLFEKRLSDEPPSPPSRNSGNLFQKWVRTCKAVIAKPLRFVSKIDGWIKLYKAADHVDILNRLNKQLGFLPTENFRNWYNKVLINSYKEAHLEIFGEEWGLNKEGTNSPYVTFNDIEKLWLRQFEKAPYHTKHVTNIVRANGCPLKIVSTDVTGQRLCIHPDDSSMDMPVADAVAASIAIPFVFQAKKLAGKNLYDGHHVDGGALSNFPAWIFKNRLGPFGLTVPVLGFELAETDQSQTEPRQTTDLLVFTRGLISTVVAGSKRLSTRLVADLYQIPVKASVSAYAFDQDATARKKTVFDGLTSVISYFRDNQNLVSQEQFEPILRNLHGKMLNQLGNGAIHLRVNLIIRNVQGNLQVRYGYNMSFDTDDHLQFENELAGGAGQCWEKGEPVVLDLEEARQSFPVYSMSKYEQALVRPMLRSLLCVPVFDPKDTNIRLQDKERWAILSFDSDDKLHQQFSQLQIQKWATEQASELALTWVGLATIGQKI